MEYILLGELQAKSAMLYKLFLSSIFTKFWLKNSRLKLLFYKKSNFISANQCVFQEKKISIFSNKTGEKFNLTLGLIQA